MFTVVKKIKSVMLSAMLVMASVLALTVSSLAVAGDDALSGIIESGVLKVAMSGDQPPYNMTTRDKSLMGFDVDLANALANAMEVKLEIVVLPFGELMPALNAGKADMIISGMSITAKRSQLASFIGPYNISGKSILSTAEVMEKQEDGFDNENTRIAVLDSSTSKTFAENKMYKAKLITISNYEEGVKLLLAGKADALIADMAICKLSVLRNPGSGLVTSKKPLSIEPIGIAIAANNPQLENVVRNYLETYERVGVLDTLQKKWFESSHWIIALP